MKKSLQHVLRVNVPDFLIEEAWKYRFIYSKNDLIGVLCQLEQVLTPLGSIGSLIIDGFNLAMSDLELSDPILRCPSCVVRSYMSSSMNQNI